MDGRVGGVIELLWDPGVWGGAREFLGASDAVIVRARRMMLRALDEHAQGRLPFGIDQDIDYRSIRALSIQFPKGTDWKSIDILNPPAFAAGSAGQARGKTG